MNHKKRRIIAILFVLALLVGLPCWLIYREVHRERLGQMLILALRQHQFAEARRLLQQGADASIRADMSQPHSLQKTLAHMWDQLWHRSAQTTIVPGDHPGTLLLFYQEEPLIAPDEDLALALLDAGAPGDDADEYIEDGHEAVVGDDYLDGETVLLHAMRCRHHTVVRRLLATGKQVNIAGTRGEFPLMVTVMNDATGFSPENLKDVKLLLEHGADANAKNSDGMTSLFYTQNEAMQDLLLAHGAKINAANSRGDTALFLWCRGSQYPYDSAAALALIRKDANVNAHNAKGETPLLLALTSDKEDVVRALIQQGAKVDVQDSEGKTPIGCAQDATILRLLLQHGARIDIPDSEGRTPLLLAAAKGQATSVAFLLQQGARIDARDRYGNTPLLMALECNHQDIARLLLEKGANICARDADGNTALMRAADRCDSSLFRRFLHAGIDINAHNDKGNTALSIVEQYLQTPDLPASEHADYAKKASLLRSLGAKEVKPKQEWIGGESGGL